MSPKQNKWITTDKIHHECKIALDTKSKEFTWPFFEANTSTLIEISADVLNSEHLDKAKRNVITYLNGKKVLKSKAGDINIMYIFGD